MTLTILDTTPGIGNTRDRILDLLDEHADGLGLPFNESEFSLEARDGDTFLGALTAKIVHNWVFLALLAVSPDARGQGVGSALMAALEDTSRSMGATGIWLDTFSFQAPDFYQRLGYKVFGELPDAPAGHSRFFLLKRLDGKD
ncbi:GNAT family N-acetyltransferase [Pseudoruegeria sp. HB172150]|uniref:GNAT family N-acetyltransferase n=1 Tax=Pseudoruegeria sp. HB172150 TaxID=2721164 RepID=UPI001555596D|nr:GNAT family N-acetyltransferase [Pseudoruegeria sp. HB172150]